MADPVTAAVLAEALREAVPQMYELAETHEEYCDYDAAKVTLAKAVHWHDLLDRYDAQCREGIEREIRSNTAERREMMRYARERVNPAHTMFCVLTARHANHRILTLRRQLRELERHTNGTH